jgi:hypothetical protein
LLDYNLMDLRVVSAGGEELDVRRRKIRISI